VMRPLWHSRGVDAPSDRLAGHSPVEAMLSSMSDSELIATLSGRDHGKVGIGGATQLIRVADTSIFVKLVRLTDVELDAGSGCTANLFDLPMCYQYGVGEGSTGFNAWREVAVHQIASDWVLDGVCSNFPLLYHWRVLPRTAPGESAGLPADIDRAVHFWGDSHAVETRLRALDTSSTILALFLEHVPFVLRDWLIDQLTSGSTQAESAVTLVEQQLLGAVAHMRSAGMSHFDAHFDNVLTDGSRIYLSDFGLATARRFQLSRREQHFIRLTADHDLAYCATALVNTIADTLVGFVDPRERNAYVQRCADSGRANDLAGYVANTFLRYASIATVVNDFYWKLYGGDLTALYPADAMLIALRDAHVCA
jgi:hypothetical protein